MHLHILIPCYGGQLSEIAFTSFVRFVVKAREWGLEWSLDTLVNESLIPRGRNALVARAMTNPLATHLLFLDADIGFDPENIMMLAEEDVDIIGGGYPKKSLPIDYVINPLRDGISDDNKAEVERIGTGFLLVKRSVFETLALAMPELKYVDDCGLDPSLNKYLYAYFECGLFGQKVYMSEDWLFCNRWRSLGGKIFISKRFALTHVGSYAFCESSQSALLVGLGSAPREVGSIGLQEFSPVDVNLVDPELLVVAKSEPAAGKPAAGKPAAGKPAAGKPAAGKPAAGKPAAGKPAKGTGS